MRGRRSKPVELKVLEGNPGHRPLGLANHPAPRAAVPTCPKWLVGEARREWQRLAPQLMSVGLLTELDRGTLALVCAAWGRYVSAEIALTKLEAQHEQLKEELEAAPADSVEAEKLAAKINKVWGEICVQTGKRKHAEASHTKLVATLGLSPASRSGIKVTDGQQELPLGQPESAFDRTMRLSAS